jgi:conjugal transfer mating pair stabilization protein TraG
LLGIAEASAKASATAGIGKRWNSSDVASVTRDADRIDGALEQWSTNRGWSNNRDVFNRSVSTSSRSDVSSQASGISSSVTNAETHSREARRYFETASRLESRWSLSDGRSVAGSLNTTDAFLDFARAEIASTPLVYRHFDPANAADWHCSDPDVAGERTLLVTRYIERAGSLIREDAERQLHEPSGDEIISPAVAPGTTSFGASHPERLGRLVAPPQPQRHDTAIRGEVMSRLDKGGKAIRSRNAVVGQNASGAGDLETGPSVARDKFSDPR